MEKLKEMLHDRTFIKYSLFIAFNAVLLYILYFLVKNSHAIVTTLWGWLGTIWSSLSFLFVGLLLAYLLAPLVEIIDQKFMSKFFFKLPEDPIKLERRLNLRRLISVFLTFIVIIIAICAIIYAFAVLIMGEFVFDGILNMAKDVVAYFLTYEQTISRWVSSLPGDQLAGQVELAADAIFNWISNHFDAATILDFVTGISISIFNLALGTIVSIYLLKDAQFFKCLWRKFLHIILPQKANAIVTETLHDIDTVLSQFIRGALLDALIVAILSSVGLSLMGLDFAVFIGCFAGIANVIPYFGPILGMIPAFIVGTFTGGLFEGILAVGILFIVQQIDCNIIYPKIVGTTTGLHPLFVLLAVTVAGYHSGILGMIIAVPIAGIIQVFVVKWVHWMDG